MKITPEDIDNVEEVGTMNKKPVKLIRTKGGFIIAVGKKKGATSEEALGAGSHPAIVKYNLEKQYPDYEPAMMKSESGIEPIVEKHSHFLNDNMRKGGYDIYSLQDGPSVEFQITKHNAVVANVKGSLDEYNLFLHDLSIPKQFSKAMAGSALEKAISCKVGLSMRK